MPNPYVAAVVLVATVAGTEPTLETPPVQTLCGWYANPTPANHLLFDRDRRWVISEQGGHRAEGLEDMPEPDHATAFWVRQNTGAYGYGCYCLRAQTDPQREEIRRIFASEQQPLEVCRADPNLPAWEG